MFDQSNHLDFMKNSIFLKNPATLISLGLHAAVILFYAPSIQDVLHASGRPQSVKVSLKSFERLEKTPVKKIAKTLPKKIVKENPAEIVSKNIEPVQETAEETIELPSDFDNPHFSPTPTYPRQARLRGLQGQVKLKLGINGLGEPIVINLVESSGYQVLDHAALEGLKRWRFSATNNSVEIAFWTEKIVEFRLN